MREDSLARVGVGVGGRAVESLARMGVGVWKCFGPPSLMARKDMRGFQQIVEDFAVLTCGNNEQLATLLSPVGRRLADPPEQRVWIW